MQRLQRLGTYAATSFVPSRPSLPPLQLDHLSTEIVMKYLDEGIAMNELLFSSLKGSDVLLKAPDPLRRPLIFYMTHNAAFATVKLSEAGLVPSVNYKFEELFERGVWELPGDDTKHTDSFEWPSEKEVNDYISQCNINLRGLVAEVDWAQERVGMESPLWALMMAMEHDRIHFETSSVLIRQLPLCDVARPAEWNYAPQRVQSPEQRPQNGLVQFDPTEATLGRRPDNAHYGWDNEYGCLHVDVPAFACSKLLVSNAEFLDFVHADGYRRSEFWSTDGWVWLTGRQVEHPIFWVPASLGAQEGTLSLQETLSMGDPHEEYRYRAMLDVLEMPWDWPAEVNHYEATAYCAWRSQQDRLPYRLPTEAEFHVCHGVSGGQPVGSKPSQPSQANIALQYGSPSPVDFFEPNEAGIYDSMGNVWQMLSTEFKPLPGWKPHRMYPDFSEPHFNEQNRIALGGSWASAGEQTSEHYRLWWLRHFYQHMGFRMAITI